MDWMFMSSKNSYAGILIPTVMEFEGGGLWEVIRSWGGTVHKLVSL